MKNQIYTKSKCNPYTCRFSLWLLLLLMLLLLLLMLLLLMLSRVQPILPICHFRLHDNSCFFWGQVSSVKPPSLPSLTLCLSYSCVIHRFVHPPVTGGDHLQHRHPRDVHHRLPNEAGLARLPDLHHAQHVCDPSGHHLSLLRQHPGASLAQGYARHGERAGAGALHPPQAQDHPHGLYHRVPVRRLLVTEPRVPPLERVRPEFHQHSRQPILRRRQSFQPLPCVREFVY